MKNIKVDYLVIGAGLTGLATARAIEISHPNLKGLIAESSSVAGGSSKAQETLLGLSSLGLRQIPGTDLAVKALNFLERVSDLEIIETQKNLEPLTFSDGSLKPFVGFGDASPEFYSELSYFLKPNFIELKTPLFEVCNKLAQDLKTEIKLKSEVTQIEILQNGFSVIVNGQYRIDCSQLVATLPIKKLARLIPGGFVPQKLAQKLAKIPSWSAVHLDLISKSTTTDQENLHVLFGTSSELVSPIWGRFHKANESGLQLSQWMTFVRDPESDDPENLSHALKLIKRQIKRAYPDMLSQIEKEKIMIFEAFGQETDLKIPSAYSWPKADSLFLATGTIASESNLVGSLLQAELVSAAFDKKVFVSEEISKSAEL